MWNKNTESIVEYVVKNVGSGQLPGPLRLMFMNLRLAKQVHHLDA